MSYAHTQTHSFRRGAATSACRAGLSEFEVQLLGCWKSDSFKLYIDSDSADLLRLGQRLHGLNPLAIMAMDGDWIELAMKVAMEENKKKAKAADGG
jgi:hypothetical protein